MAEIGGPLKRLFLGWKRKTDERKGRACWNCYDKIWIWNWNKLETCQNRDEVEIGKHFKIETFIIFYLSSKPHDAFMDGMFMVLSFGRAIEIYLSMIFSTHLWAKSLNSVDEHIVQPISPWSVWNPICCCLYPYTILIQTETRQASMSQVPPSDVCWFINPSNCKYNWLVVSKCFKYFFMFHNIWDNPSHWLSYFSRWLLHHQPV